MKNDQHHHGPPPQRVLYPRATAAGNPRRAQLGGAAWISAACAVAIVLVVGVTLRIIDTPASDAADKAAVASSRPSAQVGVPVPQRQTEYAPPAAERIPGDGTWLITLEVKRGTYRSEGGERCYWARLRDLSNELGGIIANGFARPGPQVVAMGAEDKAFSTAGCGQWVMVK